MNYPLRSIAFIGELIHPPVQHKAEDLQKLHAATFNDEACRYQNFQVLPMGAQMTNTPAGGQNISACAFLNDRIQVREELTGMSREDYENRLSRIVSLAMELLTIPVFMMEQFVVRSLVNPRQFQDSREFIGKALLNLESENLAPLGRKPEILGLRFALAPPDPSQGVYNLRIESYSKDPRSLFIENVGSFRGMVRPEDLDTLTSNFRDTYEYVESEVVSFLAQYDQTT